MERIYHITSDQLEEIGHFKRMFELEAGYINELCSEERDDVVYGFQLGQIHSRLRTFFINMMELEDEIQKQEHNANVPEDKKLRRSDEILNSAAKEAHDAGNQSTQSVAKRAIEIAQKEMFYYLYELAENSENEEVNKFFEKLDATLIFD